MEYTPTTERALKIRMLLAELGFEVLPEEVQAGMDRADANPSLGRLLTEIIGANGIKTLRRR